MIRPKKIGKLQIFLLFSLTTEAYLPIILTYIKHLNKVALIYQRTPVQNKASDAFRSPYFYVWLKHKGEDAFCLSTV